MSRYRAHNWHCFGGLEREPYAALYTTLAAPITARSAAFSAVQVGREGARSEGQRQHYRFWTPARVIEEIDVLVNRHGVRNINRRRDVRAAPRHVLGICDAIIDRGYKLNIWAYAAVDTVRDEMLDKLNARASLGWRWHRGRQRGGPHRRRQRYRVDEVYETVKRSGRRGSTSSATTSSAFGRHRRHDAADARSCARSQL